MPRFHTVVINSPGESIYNSVENMPDSCLSQLSYKLIPFRIPADKILVQTIKRADLPCIIDNLLTMAPGTVKGPEILDDLPVWDSLSAIGFIAMPDAKLGMTLPSGKMEHCKTVADLVALAGNQIPP